ncbi:MAG: ABC transporter ATP-binding protein [Bacillota bacterium]|jgi:peptide/nickel transport system ATP-binding protein|nr:ABC transporter ATP-binding protein [Bacillota bacterium]
MSILRVENLKAHYVTRKHRKVTRVLAVDGVSFQINKNEIYGIAGESGCGKSTLLKAVSGLIKPPLEVVEGQVQYQFDDRDLDLLTLRGEQERREIRGVRISHIPQGSMSVLNPVRRIRKSFEDIIGAHLGIKDKREFEDMVRKHIEALGLDWNVMHSFPHQLSGGMRQRITIALATILRPDVIFADEPTTALDVVVQRGVVQLIKTIKKEQQNTLVIVTHDLAIHANLCDRLAIMYAGKIVEEADAEALFADPKHPYTEMLLDSLPIVGDRTTRESAPGAPPSLVHPPSGCRFHPRCPQAMERCKLEAPNLIEVEIGHRVACFLQEGIVDEKVQEFDAR